MGSHTVLLGSNLSRACGACGCPKQIACWLRTSRHHAQLSVLTLPCDSKLHLSGFMDVPLVRICYYAACCRVLAWTGGGGKRVLREFMKMHQVKFEIQGMILNLWNKSRSPIYFQSHFMANLLCSVRAARASGCVFGCVGGPLGGFGSGAGGVSGSEKLFPSVTWTTSTLKITSSEACSLLGGPSCLRSRVLVYFITLIWYIEVVRVSR